jgi:DNA-binding response OmpR family regulator
MTEHGTILAVDDTPANLKLLVDILTQDCYQVRPADSGELALASVAASPPDLILLDIRMPGLDGFEVFRRLRAQPSSRDIAVIFISASTEVDQRIEGLRLGAVDFITKPFQREELLARVHTHLELRRIRIQLERDADELQQANETLRMEAEERKRAEAERERLIAELQAALTDVKTLSGIIPICAGCKKIRDDQGYWNQLECYISEHSLARFSHGYCPDCLEKFLPGPEPGP